MNGFNHLQYLCPECRARGKKRCLPGQRRLETQLLVELHRQGGRGRPDQMYAALAEHFALCTHALSWRRSTDNSSTLWQTNVRFARQTNVTRGYITNRERGIWELSDAGRAYLRARA